jgi:hypothetical protein
MFGYLLGALGEHRQVQAAPDHARDSSERYAPVDDPRYLDPAAPF